MCKSCRQVLKIKTSTTGLATHLKTKHKKMFEEEVQPLVIKANENKRSAPSTVESEFIKRKELEIDVTSEKRRLQSTIPFQIGRSVT